MKLHTRKGRRHGRPFQLNLQFLAEWTGLEPATPGVTGRYSNQLNYHSMILQTADVARENGSGSMSSRLSCRVLVGADGIEPPTFAL